MRYIKREDGEERAAIHITYTLYLTREEFALLNKQARAIGYKNFREYSAEYTGNNAFLALSDQYHSRDSDEDDDD